MRFKAVLSDWSVDESIEMVVDADNVFDAIDEVAMHLGEEGRNLSDIEVISVTPVEED